MARNDFTPGPWSCRQDDDNWMVYTEDENDKGQKVLNVVFSIRTGIIPSVENQKVIGEAPILAQENAYLRHLLIKQDEDARRTIGMVQRLRLALTQAYMKTGNDKIKKIIEDLRADDMLAEITRERAPSIEWPAHWAKKPLHVAPGSHGAKGRGGA